MTGGISKFYLFLVEQNMTSAQNIVNAMDKDVEDGIVTKYEFRNWFVPRANFDYEQNQIDTFFKEINRKTNGYVGNGQSGPKEESALNEAEMKRMSFKVEAYEVLHDFLNGDGIAAMPDFINSEYAGEYQSYILGAIEAGFDSIIEANINSSIGSVKELLTQYLQGENVQKLIKQAIAHCYSEQFIEAKVAELANNSDTQGMIYDYTNDTALFKGANSLVKTYINSLSAGEDAATIKSTIESIVNGYFRTLDPSFPNTTDEDTNYMNTLRQYGYNYDANAVGYGALNDLQKSYVDMKLESELRAFSSQFTGNLKPYFEKYKNAFLETAFNGKSVSYIMGHLTGLGNQFENSSYYTALTLLTSFFNPNETTGRYSLGFTPMGVPIRSLGLLHKLADAISERFPDNEYIQNNCDTIALSIIEKLGSNRRYLELVGSLADGHAFGTDPEMVLERGNMSETQYLAALSGIIEDKVVEMIMSNLSQFMSTNDTESTEGTGSTNGNNYEYPEYRDDMNFDELHQTFLGICDVAQLEYCDDTDGERNRVISGAIGYVNIARAKFRNTGIFSEINKFFDVNKRVSIEEYCRNKDNTIADIKSEMSRFTAWIKTQSLTPDNPGERPHKVTSEALLNAAKSVSGYYDGGFNIDFATPNSVYTQASTIIQNLGKAFMAEAKKTGYNTNEQIERANLTLIDYYDSVLSNVAQLVYTGKKNDHAAKAIEMTVSYHNYNTGADITNEKQTYYYAQNFKKGYVDDRNNTGYWGNTCSTGIYIGGSNNFSKGEYRQYMNIKPSEVVANFLRFLP